MGDSVAIVKQIAGTAALGAALLLGPIALPAQAGYVVTLQEVGSNVVATGNGPIDLSKLSFATTTTTDPAEIARHYGAD